jgi:hypothetical protein
MMMERRDSSHGYREGTSGPIAWRSRSERGVCKGGLLDDLKKALSERILNAELDEHLGDEDAGGNANRRNGYSKKTVLTGTCRQIRKVADVEQERTAFEHLFDVDGPDRRFGH